MSPKEQDQRLFDAYIRAVKDLNHAALTMSDVAGNPYARRAFEEAMIAVKSARDKAEEARQKWEEYRATMKAAE